MFKNLDCIIPVDAERQNNRSNNEFIQTVLEEDKRVKELHEQEIKQTAENPRVRFRIDTMKIAGLMYMMKRQKIMEENRRQQLRNSNPDLRKLQLHINAAYSSGQLTKQRNDILHRKEFKKQLQRERDVQHEAERLHQEALNCEEERKLLIKKQNLRSVLLGQMVEHDMKRLEHYKEVMEDRKNMQELLEKMEQEKTKEREAMIQYKINVNKERNEFLSRQEEIKLAMQAQNTNEGMVFRRMLAERTKMDKLRKEENEKIRLEKEAISKKIGQHVYNIEREKRLREDLLNDLLVEERKAKDQDRDRKVDEHSMKQRAQFSQVAARYRYVVLPNQKQERKDDDQYFRDAQAKEMAEFDRLWKMKDDRKRQLRQEYRRALQESINERAVKRAEETAENIQYYQQMQAEIAKENEEIKAERNRLICALPPEILKLLPSKVFREHKEKFTQ